MVTPRISLIAYEARPQGRVFVKVPNEPGRFILADRCVVEVDCCVCGAAAGEPCKSDYRYLTDTHWRRRRDWKEIRAGLGDVQPPRDQITKPHFKLCSRGKP
jgi:hypothetical protein